MKKFFVFILLESIVQMSVFAYADKDNLITEGDSLPHFSVQSNPGGFVDSRELNGKPTIIIFFNTRCWDCRQELPDIEKLFAVYGCCVNFLCVGREEPHIDVDNYWKKNKFTIPYSPQGDREVYQLFATKTIPRVYIFNSAGVAVKTFKGKVRLRRLEKVVKKLVQCKNLINK